MVNLVKRRALPALLAVPALVLAGMSIPAEPAQSAVGNEVPQSDLGYPVFKGDADPMPETGVAYDPSTSYLAKIFAQDQAQGAGTDTEHDFWIDRMLARTGEMFDGTENQVAFTRGRAAFMKTHNPKSLGWAGDLAYWESLGKGSAYDITLNIGGMDVKLQEVVDQRKQTPSYFHSVFEGDGLQVIQDKFMTAQNVVVANLTLKSTSEAKDVTVTVSSEHAKTVNDNELTGSETAMNNITTVKPRISGTGFTAHDGVLTSTVTASAEGAQVKVQMGLVVEENPASLSEYQEYANLSAAEAFNKHVTDYNQWWVDNLVYLDTPENNIDKTLFYRWWLLRYNYLDADVPGNDYQFPTSMEGVLGYNNAIVLTVGMFMDDLKYFRDPIYAYGPALSVGETSKSGRFIDNPGDPANWGASFTQYITEAAWRAYQVHGGPAQMGDPLARHGEEDVNGLIKDYDSNGNHLLDYDWVSMTGNDADAVSFYWGKGAIDRAESAYLYSNALGAANFYELAGDAAGAKRMRDFAQTVRASVLDVLWEDKRDEPDEMGLYGNLLKHAYVADGKQIPWKEINNYYPFTVGLMPKKGDADYDPKYVEALRLFADADQYPVFPFYTANQADMTDRTSKGIEGSNNFSVINSTVWFRMLSSVLRDYPSKYVTPELYKQLLYWNAFAHYQNGDNRLPNQNEFWANGSAKHGGSIGYRSWIHHTILGTTNFTMIEDAMGLRPREDAKIELEPIDIGWDYFTANNISYHGQDLTIVWDKDGSHYGGPAGYSAYLNGKLAFTVNQLDHVIFDPATGSVDVSGGTAQVVNSDSVTLPAASAVVYADDARVVDIFAKAGTDISQASGGSINLARNAAVSASFTAAGTSTAAVTDGTTANQPFWGSAGTANAKDSLEIDLGSTQPVDDVRVYFYRSSTSATVSGYAAPKQFLLQYWDGADWKPVPSQARTPAYPRANLNTVRFPQIETSKLRLVFDHAPGAATGVKEVQVYSTGVTPGETTNAAPKVEAIQDGGYIAANRARLIAQLSDDGQPSGELTTHWTVVSAPEGAQVIFEDEDSPITVVRYTMPGLYEFAVTVSDGELETIATVKVNNQAQDAARVNIAPDATVETSSVTGWNRNEAINDGKAPWPVTNEATAWGTWGTQPNADGRYTAQLNWTDARRIDESRILFHDNTQGGDGGMRVPTDWALEYLDDAGNWVPIQGASEYTSEIGVFNTVTFPAVSTKSLRVSMAREMPGYPGIVEWEVYAENPTSVDPVAVRTLVGTAPKLPETVEAMYANGDRLTLPVSWAPIDPSQYSAEGAFEVVGFVEGTALLAKATVSVRPNDAVGINTFSPVNVVTQAGKAPSLPSNVIVTYNDGSTASVPVKWDEVTPDSYAAPGTFQVSGSVEGTDKRPLADVTVTPNSSVIPVVTLTSDPEMTSGKWVNQAVVVAASATDTLDQNPSIEYRIADGEWQPYTGPVTVDAQGANVLEFRAKSEDGRQSRTEKITVPIDTTKPEVAIDWDEQRRLATVNGSDGPNESGIDRVEYQIGSAGAQTPAADGEWLAAGSPVLVEDEATIFARAIDRAGNASDIAAKEVGKHANDYRRNIAPEASATASSTAGHNREAGVNDRYYEFPPSDQTHAWGTWGTEGSSYTVTLTWDKPRNIDTTSVRFYDDGDQMLVPESWTLEYLSDGEWKPVSNPSGLPTAPDEFNTITHDPVKTTALRMTLNKPENAWVGIVEWEVFEVASLPEPSDPTDPNKNPDENGDPGQPGQNGSSEDQGGDEQAGDDQVGDEHGGNRPGGMDPNGNQSDGDHSGSGGQGDGQSGGNQSDGDQPGDNNAVGNKPGQPGSQNPDGSKSPVNQVKPLRYTGAHVTGVLVGVIVSLALGAGLVTGSRRNRSE